MGLPFRSQKHLWQNFAKHLNCRPKEFGPKLHMGLKHWVTSGPSCQLDLNRSTCPMAPQPCTTVMFFQSFLHKESSCQASEITSHQHPPSHLHLVFHLHPNFINELNWGRMCRWPPFITLDCSCLISTIFFLLGLLNKGALCFPTFTSCLAFYCFCCFLYHVQDEINWKARPGHQSHQF